MGGKKRTEPHQVTTCMRYALNQNTILQKGELQQKLREIRCDHQRKAGDIRFDRMRTARDYVVTKMYLSGCHSVSATRDREAMFKIQDSCELILSDGTQHHRGSGERRASWPTIAPTVPRRRSSVAHDDVISAAASADDPRRRRRGSVSSQRPTTPLSISSSSRVGVFASVYGTTREKGPGGSGRGKPSRVERNGKSVTWDPDLR